MFYGGTDPTSSGETLTAARDRSETRHQTFRDDPFLSRRIVQGPTLVVVVVVVVSRVFDSH